jgi:hypothetical protein
MSEGVSFEEGLPSDNGSTARKGSSMKGGIYENPMMSNSQKGLTQWISDKLGVSIVAANVLQLIFSIGIFALAGYIFWSAINM